MDTGLSILFSTIRSNSDSSFIVDDENVVIVEESHAVLWVDMGVMVCLDLNGSIGFLSNFKFLDVSKNEQA